MLKLEDQLRQLPEEFTLIMEQIKDKKFDRILFFILNKFEIFDQFNDLNEEYKKDLVEFFKLLYIFGFYTGLSFGLSPYDYVKDLIDEEEKLKKENGDS